MKIFEILTPEKFSKSRTVANWAQMGLFGVQKGQFLGFWWTRTIQDHFLGDLEEKIFFENFYFLTTEKFSKSRTVARQKSPFYGQLWAFTGAFLAQQGLSWGSTGVKNVIFWV